VALPLEGFALEGFALEGFALEGFALEGFALDAAANAANNPRANSTGKNMLPPQRQDDDGHGCRTTRQAKAELGSRFDLSH
jgi:hypothetical protein